MSDGDVSAHLTLPTASLPVTYLSDGDAGGLGDDRPGALVRGLGAGISDDLGGSALGGSTGRAEDAETGSVN